MMNRVRLGLLVWMLVWVLAATPALANDLGSLEFARRLLSIPQPSGLIRGVELFPNALPDDMPVDFPVPSGAHLVGSAVYVEGGDPTSATVILDIAGDAEGAFALVNQTLVQHGWIPLDDRGADRGGFVVPNRYNSAVLCRPGEEPWLRLAFASLSEGVTETRAYVTFGSSMSRPHGPCFDEQGDLLRVGREHPLEKLLPKLVLPEGAVFYGGGGGGGSHDRDSRATVKIDMTVPALHEYFSGQLLETGWKEQGGVAQEDFAWSVWEVPSERGGVHGLLYVVAGPDSQRYLRLEVVMPEFRE